MSQQPGGNEKKNILRLYPLGANNSCPDPGSDGVNVPRW